MLFLALFATLSAMGQDIITISGRVVDNQGKGMPQVNVRTVDHTIATVTNGDGDFFLKLSQMTEDEAISFSSMGYLTSSMTLREIGSQQGELVVVLTPNVVDIEGVNIDLKDASSYIKEVFKRRAQNYPSGESYQRAFYREMVKMRQSFATLTEAVVEIQNPGFKLSPNDRAAIAKGRSMRDHRFTDTLFVKLHGGIFSSLYLDIAENEDIVFTDTPELGYRFWFDKPTTIDGRKMQVVSFNQRSEVDHLPLFRGTLYIDSLTMGIARAEFSRNVEGRDDALSYFIRKKPSNAKIDIMEANYIASYRLLDGKWRFDYCNTELNFRCNFKRRLFRSNYSIISEMVITEHNAEPKRIAYSSRVKANDFTFDSAQGFYDEDFWENYNTIEHERSIDIMIKRFLKQLNDL